MLLNPYRFGGFTPLDLANLVGWWDPSDAATVTLNGTDVSQIDDKSGKGNHFIQATATAQPALITAGQNGLNTMDFTPANDDHLATSGNATFAIETGDMYLAHVVEANVLGGNRIIFNIDHPTWIGWQLTSTGAPNWRQFVGGFASLSSSANTPQLFEYWRTGTSVRARLTGTIDTDVKTSTENFRSTRKLYLGTRVSTSFNYDGEIMETVFSDGPETSADRDACKDYLIAKWGL